jgi:hypothetical protein
MGMGSVLAERGDPAAAGYARDAIELCRRSASGEQLALAMPTAAMVCWQVGAYEQARAYIEEARPWHAGTRRIARVVLLSVSAGMALTDGDVGAAVDLGRQADLEATELGVERELPLIRAVLARSLLQRGDVAGAAECANGALDAAENMQSQFPLAICFETVALIASAAVATHSSRAGQLSLLATADVIRSRGDRLALPPLSGAVIQLSQDHGAAAAMDAGAAASLARRLLRPLAAGDLTGITGPLSLDKYSRHRRVDASDVAGVACDDGVMTLPSAEHDVDVHDVIVVSVRAHQPDAAGHAERHDRDVDVRRFEQPCEAGLARAAPRLRDDFGGDADGSAAPPRRRQACLHGEGLGGVVKR